MIQQRIDELIKLGTEIIGPRISEGHCVFCGAEVEKYGYCLCKKAEKINPQVQKLRKLIDGYGFITDLNEYTHQLIIGARFPKKFSGMSFDDYITDTDEQKYNLQIIKNYAENALEHYLHATNLIFVGHFGNGKTMLMSVAGDEIIRKFGIQVKYVNVYDLAEEIKKTFNDKNKSASAVIEGYKKAPILILDDIDKVNPSPFMIDLMYGFSNYRAENQLPTWINANHSLEDLSDKFYQEGTISRFFENSIKAKFTGINWRLRG